MLDGFMTDNVSLVKANGQRIENIGANVQAKKIFIDNGSVPIEEGDILERKLPNGLVERYRVMDRGYFAAFSGTPAHYQVQVQKETALVPRAGGTTIYNVSGLNARVNVQSTDVSTNVINVDVAQLFEQIGDAIRNGVADEEVRQRLFSQLPGLNKATTSQDYLERYQQFIASAANHMTIIAPFLPALAQLASR
jgi:hypothetical protein